MPKMTQKETNSILNVLAKWRSLLAGWQLGTRPDTDAECRAVRDHREVTLLLRAEVSALVGLLVQKGVFTAEEWYDSLGTEAIQLNQDMESRFPGVKATPTGLTFDLRVVERAGWMKGWKP